MVHSYRPSTFEFNKRGRVGREEEKKKREDKEEARSGEKRGKRSKYLY